MSKFCPDHAAFYNRIAHAYDLISDSGEGAARRQGQQELAVQSGEAVLEIGYGTGHSVVELARCAGAGGRIAGLDVSSAMRDVAEKRVRQEPDLQAQIDLSVGDARQLPYSDDSFDAAFTSFTMELFDDSEIPGVLRELRRVLRPGGRLGIVSMAKPDDPGHASRLEHAYVWLHQHFPHIVDCHPIMPESLLQQTGFTIDRSGRIAIWSLPVAIVVARKPG